MNIYETEIFKKTIDEAFREMSRTGVNAQRIGNSGAFLVRKGSSEATEHTMPGNVLYEKSIGGEVFLICAS